MTRKTLARIASVLFGICALIWASVAALQAFMSAGSFVTSLCLAIPYVVLAVGVWVISEDNDGH